MVEWVNQIETNILSRVLLRKGESLLVAVSGGVDSMVLLQVLAELAPRNRWKLWLAHFNHQLRGVSSNADEQLVRKTAQKLNLPISVGQGNVRAFAQANKLSIEMAARQLRHEFLAQTARQVKARKIATAHHADDQIELFFLRLQRGAGGEGLGGMRWIAPSPFGAKLKLIRPLLSEGKEALMSYARENKVMFREDASNQSNKFLRNRIRQEIIPVLKKQEPPIFDTVLRSMEIIRSEGEFVAEAASSWRGTRSTAFDDLHIALQRRVLHDELRALGLLFDFDLIERLRRLPGESFSISEDSTVFRDHSGVVHQTKPVNRDFQEGSVVLQLGRSGECRFGGLRLKWNIAAAKGEVVPRKDGTENFDADRVGNTVTLRHWSPGDRFHPIGMMHEIKLQDWFVNLKIPAADRRKKVVAVAENGKIFWVEGARISDRFKLTLDTGRKLKWSWKSA